MYSYLQKSWLNTLESTVRICWMPAVEPTRWQVLEENKEVSDTVPFPPRAQSMTAQNSLIYLMEFMDRGAWRAMVFGLQKSQTRLKQLSTQARTWWRLSWKRKKKFVIIALGQEVNWRRESKWVKSSRKGDYKGNEHKGSGMCSQDSQETSFLPWDHGK